jgi:hypothetical protein
MFQRDWLIRQIEMAGRVLAAIVAKAKSGQPLEALGMFDQAYQPLLGVGAKLVPVMSDDQLLDTLKPGGVPDDNRWPILVRLMTTEADLHAELGHHEDALPRYRKALLLVTELGGARPSPDPGIEAHLATQLRGYRLTPDERAGVARLYERAGRFDAAEDTLFEGLEGEQAPESLVGAATGFYRRLLARDDEDLNTGGLPRDEVEAGLAEVLSRTPTV